jgi:hypothetical protein
MADEPEGPVLGISRFQMWKGQSLRRLHLSPSSTSRRMFRNRKANAIEDTRKAAP